MQQRLQVVLQLPSPPRQEWHVHLRRFAPLQCHDQVGPLARHPPACRVDRQHRPPGQACPWNDFTQGIAILHIGRAIGIHTEEGPFWRLADSSGCKGSRTPEQLGQRYVTRMKRQ
ncbi:hypothetical protein D3C81_1796100 [compost metagenome]